jgi:carbon-monoxide dehydrogenase large subunit
MDTIATELPIAKSYAAPGHLGRTSEIGFVQNVRVKNLNIETIPSSPFLPANRKWAIRFNAGGTVTIVLGIRDYGRGWYSGYFAGLVTARLGVPFQRVRIYYTATLPAVLQTPMPCSIVFHRSHIGPVATAVADVIETMCDQVVERGRVAFAAIAGVGPGDVGFDQSSGQFFVLDRNRSGRILEIDATVRGISSVSTEFAKKLQRAHMHPLLKEIQPSAAD